MKAIISKDGVLEVIPENELEDYALSKWIQDYLNGTEESVLAIRHYEIEDNK